MTKRGDGASDGGTSESDVAGETRVGRRRFLALGAGAVACVAGGGVVGRITGTGPGTAVDRLLGRDPAPTTNNRRRLAVQPDGVIGIETSKPVVALTFDDGPDSRYTERVLAVLASYDVAATFFMVGMNAKAHPDLVAGVLEGGHTIGNHTRHHPLLDDVPMERAFAEILEGAQDLVSVGAPPPVLFRPPRGFTDRPVAAFASANGYRTIFWTECIESHLRHRTPAEAAASVVDAVAPGGIILAHDGSGLISAPEAERTDRRRTVEALPRMLEGLAERGVAVVDVPTILGVGPPLKA